MAKFKLALLLALTATTAAFACPNDVQTQPIPQPGDNPGIYQNRVVGGGTGFGYNTNTNTNLNGGFKAMEDVPPAGAALDTLNR